MMNEVFNSVARHKLAAVGAAMGVAGIVTGSNLAAVNHDPVGLLGLAAGAMMLETAYRRWRAAKIIMFGRYCQ
jgi:hypothetical protein